MLTQTLPSGSDIKDTEWHSTPASAIASPPTSIDVAERTPCLSVASFAALVRESGFAGDSRMNRATLAQELSLFDFKALGKSGDDPRFHFSWYSGDFCTDPAFADAEPEARANPSMTSWGNDGYLAQQKKRLPTHKYRRLHLSLPGAPDGAAFDADKIMASIFSGRKRLPPEKGVKYFGFVDMSGGTNDPRYLSLRRRA
jgi:hypothetical protein